MPQTAGAGSFPLAHPDCRLTLWRDPREQFGHQRVGDSTRPPSWARAASASRPSFPAGVSAAAFVLQRIAARTRLGNRRTNSNAI